MVEPTGYTALDLIGFTDKGPYDPTANYVKNDLVHVGNSTWRCKIDDTTGITPTEGANWTIFIESATSLAGMSDVDLNTPKAGDGLVHDGNDWTNIPIMTKEQWQKNGAYNLCPNKGTTQIVQSVTVTVKADLTLSTSGTASANGYFDIFPKSTELFLEKGKTYKLIDGTENDATVVGVQIFFYDSTNTSLGFYGKGDIFTVPNNTYYIYVALRIQNTVDFSGKTFMPLITSDLNATAADYVPHAMTNRQLTELVDDKFFSNFSITDPTKVSFAYGITSATVVNLSINGRKSKDNKFVTLSGWIYMKDCVYSSSGNPAIEVELPFTIPLSTNYTIDVGALIKNGATLSSGYAYKDDAIVNIRTTVENKLRITKHNFAENLVNGVTYYQILPITIAIN